jgi:hypothetical protein
VFFGQKDKQTKKKTTPGLLLDSIPNHIPFKMPVTESLTIRSQTSWQSIKRQTGSSGRAVVAMTKRENKDNKEV